LPRARERERERVEKWSKIKRKKGRKRDGLRGKKGEKHLPRERERDSEGGGRALIFLVATFLFGSSLPAFGAVKGPFRK